MKPFLGLVCGALFLFFLGCSDNQNKALPAFTLSSRPIAQEVLFDYTNIFANIKESSRNYLSRLQTLYGIEACIVTLKAPPDNMTIQEAATEIVNSWKIGKEFNGKGLLFLFIESDKKVKFEISYELEDVFTDAFSGYIEDLQLRPNYLDGNLDVGIIAVFEEIERRAEVKKLGEYTRDEIEEFDSELLSGGAGASKKISSYIETHSEKQGGVALFQTTPDKGANTPSKAWKIMLNKWTGENSYSEFDIYTEATKSAMGDQNNPNDKRVSSQAKLLLKHPFFVKQDRGYAIVHFNKKKGWEYAPYLFTNDGTGWKFDIVSQRKFVVFGNKSSWHLERGDHQYNALFGGFKGSLRKDIPFTDDVSYQVDDDLNLAERIIELEREFTSDTQDFSLALELGRLGVVTARRPQHVYKPLNRAKELAPTAAEPHKYLAVYHVMSTFQYESALKEIQEYTEKVDSVFGHNFQGFLHHKLKEYGKAVAYFNKSLQVKPSVYAYSKLSRAEAMLFVTSPKRDPWRSRHQKKAVEAYNAAREIAPGSWRIPILETWLRHKSVLQKNP